MRYNAKILAYFENAQNVGSFEKDDFSIGTALVGTAANGDVVQLQIKINKNEVIEEAKFKAQASVVVVAISAWLTEYLKGKSLTIAEQITAKQIADELVLPTVKFHCSSLVEAALKAAIIDYRKKIVTVQALSMSSSASSRRIS